MNITKKWIENMTYGNRDSNRVFFDKHFPNGGELEDIWRKAKKLKNGRFLYWLLGHVDEEHRTYDFCLATVRLDGFAFKYVPKKYRTYEMCFNAVKSYGFSLGEIPKELIDFDICLAAIKQNPDAICCVTDKFEAQVRLLQYRAKFNCPDIDLTFDVWCRHDTSREAMDWFVSQDKTNVIDIIKTIPDPEWLYFVYGEWQDTINKNKITKSDVSYVFSETELRLIQKIINQSWNPFYANTFWLACLDKILKDKVVVCFVYNDDSYYSYYRLFTGQGYKIGSVFNTILPVDYIYNDDGFLEKKG